MSTVNNVPTNEMWVKVKKELRSELGDDIFSNWFGRVNHEETTDGTVRLSVPTHFLKRWITSNYIEQLLGLWRRELPEVKLIELTVRGAMRPKGAKQISAPSVDSGEVNEKIKSSFSSPTQVASLKENRHEVVYFDKTKPLQSDPISSKFTFDTFIVGESNELAYAAAKRVVDTQSCELNPLFLYSATGFGKTHLMQAAAAKALDKGLKVLYLEADHFTPDFLQGCKKDYAALRSHMRTFNIVLIENIQILCGNKVSREMCAILGMLIDGSTQVIVTADRAASEFSHLDERIQSRLSGGMLVEIQESDKKLRQAILSSLLERVKKVNSKLEVKKTVLDYVINHVTASNRYVVTALNRLIAHAEMTQEPITQEIAEKLLHDLVSSFKASSVKIEDIQRVVCKHSNVTRSDLLSARRARAIVRPRQIAMYLCKEITGRSLPEIGRRFGNRDHTTVLHAVRKIEEMSGKDVQLANELSLLKRMIQH